MNDKVRVRKDQELVKKLQNGHGEWAEEMIVVCRLILYSTLISELCGSL